MQESLKRDLNKTYLVLSADKEEYEESYELEMILKNAPATILPLHVMRMDGKVEISYDISSKQTLKEFMLHGNLPGSMVRELFSKIVMLGDDMKNYLLDIESVLLDPEHIYRKEESFCFCYCPWEKNDSAQMLQKLLEELLGKVDYSDARGIELSYHLYQASCGGAFDIRKILQEHPAAETGKSADTEEKVFIHHGMEEPGEEQSLWSLPEEAEKPETEKKKSGIFGWLIRFFMKKEEPEEKEKPVEYPDAWEEINKLHIPGEEENFCFGEAPGVYEASPVREAQTAGKDAGTVLLNSGAASAYPGSVCKKGWKLCPLVPGYEEFSISGESFLVGKKRENVDGYIERETISRIHSRLYVKEERLYIADANSTNGTYVNGEALPPGTDTEIFAGDRVMFADVGYECCKDGF